jgi:LmbE family N-acetylglucosaminyl deacetylase
MDDQRKLLAVLAHPDDESFGLGGTLAAYAARGVEVHLICATGGEVGTVSPEMLRGFSDIGELRRHELRCAAEELGLKKVHFLQYRDSGMPGTADNRHPDALAAAPKEEVAAQIAHLIRQLQPQVVVTFDPFGGYGHPDHIAIHEATVAGFYAAGNPDLDDELPPYSPQKLYFHTFPRKIFKWFVRLMPILGRNPRKYGRNQDIDLVVITEQEFPVHATLDIRASADQATRASNCHASQLDLGTQSRGVMGWIFNIVRRRAKDTFMRAYPEPDPTKKETDLFAGVNSSAHA